MSIELNRNASIVDQLKTIASMAYGSREGDAGGAGRIGMLNGRVVKFNTHLGERLFGAKADQRMYDSCNNLRRTLSEIARQSLGNTDDRLLREVNRLLGVADDGQVTKGSARSLLDRKVVATVINKLADARGSRAELKTVQASSSRAQDTSFATVTVRTEREAVGKSVPFTVEAYTAKLDYLKKYVFTNERLAKLDGDGAASIARHLKLVEKTLAEYARIADYLDAGEDFDEETGERVRNEVTGYGQLITRFQKATSVPVDDDDTESVCNGLYVHLDNVNLHWDNVKDKGDYIRYLQDQAASFVVLMTDLCFVAENAGKLDAFVGLLSDLNREYCCEAKIEALQKFMFANRLMVGEDVAPAGKAESAPIADHGVDNRLDECIYKEIDLIDQDEKNVGRELTWEKDYLPVLTQKLVGLKRPIVTAVNGPDGTPRLEPLLDDKGRAVVREVTADDLAPLGPAIMAVILGEI